MNKQDRKKKYRNKINRCNLSNKNTQQPFQVEENNYKLEKMDRI